MISRFWHFSWPSLRAVVLALTFGALIVQSYVYVKREILLSAYTPVTEAELYCVAPTVARFKHQGNGRIKLWIEGVEESLTVGRPSGAPPVSVTREGSFWVVHAVLQPGGNSLLFEIDGQSLSWNAMFTPQADYAAQGNSAAKLPGVIGLYPSSLCMGKPALSVANWSPRTSSSSLSSSEILAGRWRETFVESVRTLEGARGVPDAAIEAADLAEVVRRLEDRTSQGWCTQIALYTVARLHGQVPVRLLGSVGLWNEDLSVRTGGHSFLEYLDPQTRRWAVADPTSYIFAVRDRTGRPLNAVELGRALSLPDNVGADALSFSIVDAKSASISELRFTQLPDAVQRDLRFYFQPMNFIIYQSGKSSAYSHALMSKIEDWLLLDRRFVFQLKKPSFSVATVRWTSFWLILVGIAILLLGELAWRRVRGRRAS